MSPRRRLRACWVPVALSSLLAALPTAAQTKPPPADAGARADDDYWSEPRGDYDGRRRAFLEHAAAAQPGGLYTQIARMELGRGPLDEAAIKKGIETLRVRRDGADFAANALIRMYQHGSPLLSPALRQEIKAALLGMKYWVDEPGGKDLLSMWSENHQINYHAAQLLAGELFPDETFTNNGKPGRWHAQTGRRRVLKWIDVKGKTGFSEWDSNNCYINTSAAVMNVAELSRDPEAQRRAAMIVDVMFLDIAADSWRGSYGTAHGRTYPRAITAGGATEDTTGLQRIAWGMGALGKPDNPAAIYLAASKRYRVPRVIELAAQHLPDRLVNRERQSLLIADGKRFGLDYDDPEDFFLLNGSGKYSTPEYLERALRVIDKVNVYRYGLVMRPYAEALLATYKELARQGKPIPDLDNQSLARVDKYTYRTPDYQLSTVQDYRKGLPGSQQHVWQATLGPSTQVFTINPGGSSKYWQGRLPRNGQHENVLVAIYDVPAERPPGPKTVFPPDAKGDAVPSPAPSEEPLLPRTLAVFRRAAFDEVIDRRDPQGQQGNGSGWLFGRKGDGYVALWSRAPTSWSSDVFGGEGLTAEGRKNVWVCQLGRQKVDGPFAAWAARIAAARIDSTEASVSYAAPGVGAVSFAWEGPLKVAGRAVALAGYPRFDNPFARAAWGSGRYQVAHAGHKLVLDFTKGERRETAPPDKTRRGRRPPR
jgi:hypothetical protein